MRLAFAALLAVHGIAHLVGFVVPWRVASLAGMPYRTTILAGKVDVGDTMIRVFGVLWLLTALALLGAAGGWIVHARWAPLFTAGVLLLSLVLCAIEWPDARIGLFINIALLAALPLVGSAVWHEASRQLREDLASGASISRRAYDRSMLEGLPEPVSTYFRRTLPDGQPFIATAELVQDAEFFVGGAWRPLAAMQRFTTTPPGFVWDARIRMAPLVPVFVRDSYVNGAAAMRGTLLGVYPLVDQAGAPELDAGALVRYLAEAVWVPTALLPGSFVTWRPIDHRSALATIADGRTRVSAQFRFDENGDVREIFAPDRFREVNGAYVPTPWLVRCTEHDVHGGVRIPVRCEVEWQLQSGALPYWRGRITQISYDFGTPE